ncbi:MAG: ABC transporter ATP-binding protein [Bacteroidales bacterium]|nr:ABC transporter ATP-binding protein [Bacteroidales bacterium]
MKDLSVAFGDRKVVENLHYTLRRGETLGIVGESGSGKSVSTMALMGLLPKSATVSGHAWLSDKPNVSDVSDPSGKSDLLTLDEAGFRAIRGKRISMIFQEPMTSLNPVQKCGEQVMEMMGSLTPSPSPIGEGSRKQEVSTPLANRRGAGGEAGKEAVIELFKEVMLPRPEKIFDSYPHEISGGQKQRVMIAMALINHPDILIADEPTTALDVTVQKTILVLLKQLQQKYGTAIIFITHDLGVISHVADDILVMYRGKMVEQGPADEILHHPQQPYTQGLLACRPPLDSRPRRLPTVEDYLNSLTPGPSPIGEGSRMQEVPTPLSNRRGAGGEAVLISVRDLSVTYTLKKSLFGRPLQTLKGVDGVSFDIREGETLGLVGESGCGKTTLGRALLRLIDHSDGSISYRGTPLDHLSSHQMRSLRPRLQIIFQDPYSSLNPRITIGEAIAEPLRVHGRRGVGREAVIDLMQQVGLDPDWYSRYPHQLSGGQRQRVCIARALILQPELVICDESVSALDVSVQAQVLNLLNDLKERYHYTYLFITHDLSVVHYMADRIMVMQKGKIVESGTPDDIFNRPQTDYTRTLIDAIPRI